MNRLENRFPIYSRALRLYPEPYRKQYARSLLQTTADLIDSTPKDEHRAIWVRIAMELPMSVTTEQLQYIGGVMRETPSYIKYNGLLAGLLLIPFFTALTANSIDQLLQHQTLYHTWLWQTPFIQLWVLDLPLIAFLIAAGSYVTYFIHSRHSTLRSRMFDMRHAWPIGVPALLALGIIFVLAFHDTGQCWHNSPAYLAGHLRQAWQCTTQNQSLPIFKHLI